MPVATRAIRGTHAVQFYDSEPYLLAAIERFFATALGRGEPAVMIARRETFGAVSGPLANHVLFIDVETALTSFMDGDQPDARRFEESFSRMLAMVQRGGSNGTIWMYGEMVDVLCKAGNHAAAVRLEELWNERVADQPVAVLCGYAIERFSDGRHAEHFRAVCRLHTHVIPAEGAAADRLPAHAPPPLVAPAGATTSIVYVVDDDEGVRRSLSRLLAAAGMQVRTFDSAEAFLSEVEVGAHATGCLLLDVQLLGRSGADLQRHMAEEKWALPVIAMSGSLDARLEQEALRLGAKTFLRKPFAPQALIDAIAAHSHHGR